MKKFFILSPAAVLLIISGLSICPGGFGQSPDKSARGIVIPSGLNAIFTQSCMPCHSDGGKAMAKVLLNFSKWNKYGRRTQIQKCRSICRMLTKGEMPPAQFIESSPELAVTRAQKDSICNWVSTFYPKK